MKSLLLFYLIFSFATISQAQNKNEEIFKTARENIEKHRKTEFLIQVEGIEKNELKNFEIDVEQTSHEFLFGCIIFDLIRDGETPLNEELFKNQFKKLFNFAVFPFYWAGYEPKPGLTKRDKIKEVVQWCLQNNITCKGHPLAWTHTAGTPKWLTEYSVEESKKLLEERIKKIVDDFDDEIEIWDVFNEVIHTVNWETAMAENAEGTDNRYVGRDFMSERTDFIDSCFRWAHEANPEAHLILNEFGIVSNPDLRRQFYEVVAKLQEMNTPVNGLGIQAHEPHKGRVYYSPEEIWSTFQDYSDFNLPLHVTELIPVSNGDSIKGGYKTGTWTEKEQAEFAEMIFTLSFGHPDVASINWWGFSDKNIWQENGGLVDDNLQPKQVYSTLDKLINSEWKTRKENLKVQKNNQFSFRGFKGDYKIVVKHRGKILKETNLNYKNHQLNKPFSINL
ncbi:MAG TPA: endo-1,4-beta-xylanase [Prolixibacteraceae bacterium]|nr:endo-1,4-beta-xylanase [Prolixibacteraceae bacterium]